MGGRTTLQPTWSATQLQTGQQLETPDTLLFASPVIVFQQPAVPLVQAASIAIDADAGTLFELTLTTNAVFTIANPTGTPKDSQLLTLIIFNTIGGAAGALTLDTDFDQAVLVKPASATHRAYGFQWDGTKWRFLWEGDQDVPN